MKFNTWNLMAGLNNGYLAKKKKITLQKNKKCIAILKVLWDEGYIAGFKIKNKYKVQIFLKYNFTGSPAINSIKSLSIPSKKIYYSLKQIWKLNSSDSILILNTNKGVVTLNYCKKNKIGGEPILIIH